MKMFLMIWILGTLIGFIIGIVGSREYLGNINIKDRNDSISAFMIVITVFIINIFLWPLTIYASLAQR